MTPPCLQTRGDAVLLSVKAQPRAARSELAGLLGTELKIRVVAPPVDDAANEALVRYLAETLKLPPRAVRLVRGRSSGHKTFEIVGLSVTEVARRLGL